VCTPSFDTPILVKSGTPCEVSPGPNASPPPPGVLLQASMAEDPAALPSPPDAPPLASMAEDRSAPP